MTNNKLTNERIKALLDCVEMCEDMSVDENAEMAAALLELLERRKADSAEQPSVGFVDATGTDCECVCPVCKHEFSIQFEY